jgi:hypothetical protein
MVLLVGGDGEKIIRQIILSGRVKMVSFQNESVKDE